MRVILSIKPEFANSIFEGTKHYEFRRVIFKDPNVNTVLVYASSPVQKVIGEFKIDSILQHDVNTLWNKTKHQAGISKEYFDHYFDGKDKGFAIKIKSTRRYRKPKCIKTDFKITPPQSYAYLH